MLKEQLAIKAITGIISQWEKIQKKLETAIDSLKEVISKNKEEIQKLNEKNDELMKQIKKADGFKNNVEKMLNK